jgi:hypothetical protein
LHRALLKRWPSERPNHLGAHQLGPLDSAALRGLGRNIGARLVNVCTHRVHGGLDQPEGRSSGR